MITNRLFATLLSCFLILSAIPAFASQKRKDAKNKKRVVKTTKAAAKTAEVKNASAETSTVIVTPVNKKSSTAAKSEDQPAKSETPATSALEAPTEPGSEKKSIKTNALKPPSPPKPVQ
jgi:hypothetical protein